MYDVFDNIVDVTIAENREIAQDIFLIGFELPASYPDSNPGEFVNVYLNNYSKLLPRPISIFDHEDGRLKLVYAVVGKGTKELSGYQKDTQIKISTPRGTGFHPPTDGYEKVLLVGGGIGIAPLHYLAKQIHTQATSEGKEVEISAILGYNDKPYINDYFTKYCNDIQLTSERPNPNCIQGNVMIPINKNGYDSKYSVYVCGPKPMLKAISDYANDKNLINVQLSMEERMGCGFGACVGCSIDTIYGKRKVCTDGPVFEYDEIIWK